jgi:outer membrane lipoprotein-sorting protein
MKMHLMKRFTLVLVAMTGLGIAPLIGQTPSLQTVSLSADIDVVNVRTLSDGNTLRQERKMKFYRRADGSTRLEEPNRVVIVDNGAQTVTVLDPISKTAQVQATPMASTNGRKPVAGQSQLQVARSSLGASNTSAKTDLGVRVIAGYRVHGVQQSTTIPANSALGNTAPVTKTIEVWRSSDLRLPLLTVISDPLGGTTTSQFENVSTATPPDSSLFTVPAGYKTVPAPQSRIIASQTN